VVAEFLVVAKVAVRALRHVTLPGVAAATGSVAVVAMTVFHQRLDLRHGLDRIQVGHRIMGVQVGPAIGRLGSEHRTRGVAVGVQELRVAAMVFGRSVGGEQGRQQTTEGKALHHLFLPKKSG